MGSYTVKNGDNPSAIAKKHGLTLQQLADYNPKYSKQILSGNINAGDTYNLSSSKSLPKNSSFGQSPMTYEQMVAKGVQEEQEKRGSESLQPGAYYVNYSDYDVSTGIGDGKQRLGHSGVLLVDNKGKLSYYEYGRYTGGIGVQSTVGNGVWRKQNITGNTLSQVSKSLLKNQPEESGASTVRLTHVPADITKVEEYILNDANNPNRRAYNIPGIYGKDLSKFSFDDKSCASEASDAISAGWNASGPGKFFRNLWSALRKLNPFRTAYEMVEGSSSGRGVGVPILNYTSQDYEDKWTSRGYDNTYSYQRK